MAIRASEPFENMEGAMAHTEKQRSSACAPPNLYARGGLSELLHANWSARGPSIELFSRALKSSDELLLTQVLSRGPLYYLAMFTCTQL
jgi:hypothetical protein